MVAMCPLSPRSVFYNLLHIEVFSPLRPTRGPGFVPPSGALTGAPLKMWCNTLCFPPTRNNNPFSRNPQRNTGGFWPATPSTSPGFGVWTTTLAANIGTANKGGLPLEVLHPYAFFSSPFPYAWCFDPRERTFCFSLETRLNDKVM